MGLKALGSPIFMMSGGLNPPSTISTGATLNAAGESISIIGVLRTSSSGSKTISAAGGGRILWKTGNSVTFSNAGTTLRVGIQDVSGGLEDGTFDVYADYVGGTDTLNTSSQYRKAMSSGTKTMSYGDIIAITLETISIGGSDSVTIGTTQSTYGSTTVAVPYRTIDTGSGPAKSATSSYAVATIEFDDGTIGFIEGALQLPATSMSAFSSYSSSTTPDEYAACFKVPFNCTVDSVVLGVGSIASSDNYEVIIYDDPLGTPNALETITMDPNNVGSNVNAPIHVKIPSRTFTANTWYAVSARPTTTNTISYLYADFTSGLEHYKAALPFGSDIQLVARTNQTGAFSEVQPYYLPSFGLRITHLDDGKYVYPQGMIGI